MTQTVCRLVTKAEAILNLFLLRRPIFFLPVKVSKVKDWKYLKDRKDENCPQVKITIALPFLPCSVLIRHEHLKFFVYDSFQPFLELCFYTGIQLWKYRNVILIHSLAVFDLLAKTLWMRFRVIYRVRLK